MLIYIKLDQREKNYLLQHNRNLRLNYETSLKTFKRPEIINTKKI